MKQHPEVEDMPFGASFYGYQPQYVAVGQPHAPVAPVGYPHQPPRQSAAAITAGHLLACAGIGLIAGGALASVFVMGQPSVQNADLIQQQAQQSASLARDYEQRLVTVQSAVCPTMQATQPQSNNQLIPRDHELIQSNYR